MSYPRLIPSAEPFFFPGRPTGCLLVHGFTGAPKEMRWLGEYLASKGHTVLGVRLSAHATQPEDMIRSRWWDWVASVEDGWAMLSGCTERIFVIGLSMGGILALLSASYQPAAGVVAMAVRLPLAQDPRLRFIKLLSRLQRFSPKDHPPGTTWKLTANMYRIRRTQHEPTQRCATCWWRCAAGLPQVSAPALLIYSKNDQTVKASDRHMEKIYDNLGSRINRLYGSRTAGTSSPATLPGQTVFQAVGEFVAKISEETV